MTTATEEISQFNSTMIAGVPDRVVRRFRSGTAIFICPFCTHMEPRITKTVGGIQRHVYRDHPTQKVEFDNIRKNSPEKLLIVNRYPPVEQPLVAPNFDNTDRDVAGGRGMPVVPGLVNPPKDKSGGFGVPPSTVAPASNGLKISVQGLNVEFTGDWASQAKELIKSLIK